MECIARLNRWDFAPFLLLGLLMPVSVLASQFLRTPLPFPLQVVLLFVAALGLAVWIAVTWWRKRRLAHKLAAIDYQACPHCLYDLRGTFTTPPATLHDPLATVRCPECGWPSDVTRTALLWQAWARPRFRKVTNPTSAEST